MLGTAGDARLGRVGRPSGRAERGRGAGRSGRGGARGRRRRPVARATAGLLARLHGGGGRLPARCVPAILRPPSSDRRVDNRQRSIGAWKRSWRSCRSWIRRCRGCATARMPQTLAEMALVRICQLGESGRALGRSIAQVRDGAARRRPAERAPLLDRCGRTDRQSLAAAKKKADLSDPLRCPPITRRSAAPRDDCEFDAATRSPRTPGHAAPSRWRRRARSTQPRRAAAADGPLADSVSALTPESVPVIWKQVLADLSDILADYASFASVRQFLRQTGWSLRFAAKYNSCKAFCERPDQLAKLRSALATVTGQRVAVEFALTGRRSRPTPPASGNATAHGVATAAIAAGMRTTAAMWPKAMEQFRLPRSCRSTSRLKRKVPRATLTEAMHVQRTCESGLGCSSRPSKWAASCKGSTKSSRAGEPPAPPAAAWSRSKSTAWGGAAAAGSTRR